MTASIGVLNSGLISFDPPLPDWKVDALASQKMATYVKIFAQWDKKWWKDSDFAPSTLDGMSWVVMMDGDGDDNDTWKVMGPLPTEAPIILFSAIDVEGERVEALTDDEVKEEITEKLRKAYPLRTVPEPDYLIKSDWTTNEFTKGAYSFVGMVPEGIDIEDIRSPVQEDDLGGIFFAGEGMSSRYQSYLHAAYHSGTETADEIIEYMGYAFATGLSFSIRSLIPLAIAALFTK